MIVDVESIRFISPGVAVENRVANLTKDEAPALLHFADGQTQQPVGEAGGTGECGAAQIASQELVETLFAIWTVLVR